MSDPDPDNEPCCFDDWVGHWEKRARKGETAAPLTAPLLDALSETGLRGRTVLDVGCGIGDLAIATIERGAARASGVDVSSEAVRVARELAVARGVSDRAEFAVGDGSTVDLPPADVVVLNRVFCCYRDADQLLERSLAAAASVYAFTAPPSSGAASWFVRATGVIANAWYRLRESKFHGFRVHVHDLDRMDERIRAAGFRRVRWERRRLVWQLAVYAR